jgi:MFS family permease
VTRLVVLLAVAALIALPVFGVARDRARAAPAIRARLLVASAIGVTVGLVAALWLPRRIPETPGSPASLVGVLVLWSVGGGLALLSAAALLGAIVARPNRHDA